MFRKVVGLVKRVRVRGRAIMTSLLAVVPAIASVARADTGIDTSSMTQMISTFMPIIMSLFAIMIPLLFFGKIMEFFERLLKSFS